MKKALLLLVLAVTSLLTSAKDNWVLPGIKGGDFHDGISVVRPKSGKPYGIDRDGKTVIPAVYLEISDFIEGCAIVKNDNRKQGLIDINGNLIIDCKYEITDCSENTQSPLGKGLFLISDGKKKGLFYKSALVVPIAYEDLSEFELSTFPLIKLKEKGATYYLNIHNGKKYDGIYGSYLDSYIRAWNTTENHIYKQGTFDYIDGNTCQKSSKGTEVFFDGKIKKYGLKNSAGTVIVPAEYTFDTREGSCPIWQNDFLFLNKDGKKFILNAEGKCLIVDKQVKTTSCGLLIVSIDGHYDLMDQNGKYLLNDPKVDIIIEYRNGYFTLGNVETIFPVLYDSKIRKVLPYTLYSLDKFLNTAIIRDDKELYGFINYDTGKIIKPQYDGAYDFSEGLAYVRNKKGEYFIDERGKVIISGIENYMLGSYNFSEGVLASVENYDLKGGYLIDPRGTKYRYGVKSSEPASKWTEREWMTKGHELFNKKNYSEAKDYFYKAAIVNKENYDAVINYGACLQNMGFLDEALEAYNMVERAKPGYADVSQRISTLKEYYENQEKLKRSMQNANQNKVPQQQYVSKKTSFWNTLAAIGNVMFAVGNAYMQASMNSSSSGSSSSSGRSSKGDSKIGSGAKCPACNGSKYEKRSYT